MIRVGFIGAGLMGQRRAAAARAVGFELGSVYDPNPDACARFLNEFGTNVYSAADVIDDSDVVVVATPNASHYGHVFNALHAGARVLVEKPVGVTLGEVKALQGWEDRLRAGFHLRHYPHLKRLRQLVRDGDLGEVQRVTLTYGSPRPDGFSDTWRASKRAAGGGVLIDQGVHLLDLAVYLLGSSWTLASAQTWGYGLDYDVEDTAAAVVRWGGTVVNVLCSWRWRSPRFSVAVDGTDATAEVSGLGGKYGPPTITVNGMPLIKGSDPGERIWEEEWVDWLLEPAGVGSDGTTATELALRVYGA